MFIDGGESHIRVCVIAEETKPRRQHHSVSWFTAGTVYPLPNYKTLFPLGMQPDGGEMLIRPFSSHKTGKQNERNRCVGEASQSHREERAG
jgi:hypothetical protein